MILAAILAYLAAQVAIGVWVAPRIRTEDDFLVAGRRLGMPLTVFSLFATWFGAETVIASSARTAEQGISLTAAEPFAYGVCLLVAGLVFAGPLWKRKLTTLADLFRDRYSPTVEKAAATLLIPTSLLWAAAQLKGFGYVLTSVTTIDAQAAVALAAAFCIAYTMFGGLLADAITDLVQGVVLVIGLVVLAVIVVSRLGGPAEAFAAVDPARLALLGGEDLTPLGLLEEWAIPVFGSVLAGELVSRLIAARSPEVARNGALAAGAMYIAVGLLPVIIGLTAVGLAPRLEEPEQFLPAVARAVLHPAAFVLFAGAVISAILSTVDTVLLVSSGFATHNIIAPALRITDERTRLRLNRWGVLVLGVVSWLIAMRGARIGELVEEASAFGSAGIVVVGCFGLFTRFGGATAALITLVAGAASYVGGVYGGLPYPFLTSLAVAVACYVGVAVARRKGGS